MELSEKDYAYWLFNVEGVGNASADKLLCSGLSCREVYQMGTKELTGLLSRKKAECIEKSRYSWDFEAEKKKLEEKGINFVSRIDPEFPEKLKNIPGAPFAIYVKGSLPNPKVPSVSIVGARMCSEYGRYMARQFGRGLALAGVQVISGMARGIDGIAQSAAVEAGGKSFGIMGCGVDICYPPENKPVYDALLKKGGVISEYPPGMKPEAKFFPMRNRIISALSDVLLVVEARQKSGTSITVDTALEQGREVLAVPGRVTDRLSDGCNYLISQGAGVAISVEDVLDRLWNIKGRSGTGDIVKAPRELFLPDGEKDTDDEMAVNRELTLEEKILEIVDIIPVSTSYIAEELFKKGENLSMPALMTTLMDMTCCGKIAQNGAYYRKIA